jgi:hypothetical protein
MNSRAWPPTWCGADGGGYGPLCGTCCAAADRAATACPPAAAAAVADRGCRAQVALQFPDHLLQDSVDVAAWLSQRVVGRTFFVIGDTSYGRWEPPRSSSSSSHTRMVYCSLHAVPPSPLATAG